MTNHKDLHEKIFDKGIRDALEEVFSDPHNGQPNQISEAGALALLRKGKEIWNTWRLAFPVHSTQLDGRKLFDNIATFRNTEFKESEVDLSGIDFGDCALFIHCTWSSNTKFDEAKFGNNTHFIQCKWTKHSTWNKCSFGESNNFYDCEWFGTRFDAAQFGSQIRFFGCKWHDFCIFDNTSFNPHTQFIECEWRGQVRFLSLNNGKRSTFYDLKFKGCGFFDLVDFTGLAFEDALEFGKSTRDASKPLTILGIDYKISGRPGRCEFKQPPLFLSCQFSQNTKILDAIFPMATGSERAISAYRALKLAFSGQQAIREEQFFFRKEMDEEMKAATWVKRQFPFVGSKALYAAYYHLSEYGFSVWRPLLGIVSIIAIFAFLRGIHLSEQFCLGFSGECEIRSDWIAYGIFQTIPIPGLSKIADEFNMAKEPLLLIILLKALGISMVFLLGLALRNLFKLK